MLQTELGQIETVMSALDRKRPEVAAHGRRVSDYSVRLATQLGLSREDVETVRIGGLLHDVGKMLVSLHILNKPGRPTEREWQQLQIHPELGGDIAHRSGFDDDVCAVVLYHHERWDGSGYPDGLCGRSIHYLVRIVSVMDTYDALTSSRDYRERLTPDSARAVIARGAGSKFCPWIASAFLALPTETMLPPASSTPAGSSRPEGPALLGPDALGTLWPLSAEPHELCRC